MPYRIIFFDLDDTLYPSSIGLWDLIGDRIDLFIHNEIGLDWEIIPEKRLNLFNQYGTTLRGLVAEYKIDPQNYLAFVHDVPIEDLLHPIPDLKQKIQALKLEKIIFTNADRNHALRVIKAMDLNGCFNRIIDICDMDPFCKPQKEAFFKAMKLAGGISPGEVIIIDDTPRNLETAVDLGCYSIQVGSHPTVKGANAHIERIDSLDQVLPDGKNY